MSEKEEFMSICDLTTSLLNLPTDSLYLKKRDRPIALGREVAGVIGLKLGIHRTIIAEVLNKHRTATYHYERNHKRWFNRYKPYRDAYIKVMKLYKNIEEDKKQFIDRNHLVFFIKNKLKLKNCEKHDVVITIRSGQFYYKLKSDYFRYNKDIYRYNRY